MQMWVISEFMRSPIKHLEEIKKKVDWKLTRRL